MNALFGCDLSNMNFHKAFAFDTSGALTSAVDDVFEKSACLSVDLISQDGSRVQFTLLPLLDDNLNLTRAIGVYDCEPNIEGEAAVFIGCDNLELDYISPKSEDAHPPIQPQALKTERPYLKLVTH